MSIHISEQIEYAQKHFVEAMNSLNHDETMSFEDKAELVSAYKTVYPLWPHNILQLEEKLERLNPAYAGLDKWRICGEVFWVKKSAWERESYNGALLQSRKDTYLYANTGETHTLEYYWWVNGNVSIDGLIFLDGKHVFTRFSDYDTRGELPAIGENELLRKLELLPF